MAYPPGLWEVIERNFVLPNSILSSRKSSWVTFFQKWFLSPPWFWNEIERNFVFKKFFILSFKSDSLVRHDFETQLNEISFGQTKFLFAKRNFVYEHNFVSNEISFDKTKFRLVKTKFRFRQTKLCLAKRNFVLTDPQMKIWKLCCLYTQNLPFTYVLHLSMIRAISDSVAKC